MSIRIVLLALLVLVVPTVGLAADKPKDLIVGKWKPVEPKEDAVLEFTKDGKVKVSGKDITIEGSYKFLDDTTMEVKLQVAGEDMVNKLKVTITKDELTTTATIDGKERKDRFARAK